MNEHTSTSSHSYVISYGMSREPFGDKIEDDLFYAEPTRKQKLDILLHLTQYGNELMIVTGPTGSGKTTVLQQFQLHALDTWKVARIEAKNGIDERKLVQQLFHQMNLEFHGATHAELLEHLEHHFDSLQHSARQAVMLIDDAEQLPVTALNCVLALAKRTSKDNKPLLRIVLFGNEQLEENLADPLLDQYNTIVRRNIDLPVFDSEQTAHYILHRLSAANFADNKPFTDAALQKIHKQSHGWPGEINQLAHNLLVESAPTVATDTTKNKASTFNTSRAILAAVGITVISVLLYFQDDFNAWIDNNTDETATTSLPLALPTAPPTDAQPEGAGATEPKTETAMEAPQTQPSEDPAVILAQMYGKSDSEASTAPTVEPPATSIATPAKIELADKKDVKVSRPTATAPTITTPTAAITPSSAIPADLPGHRTDWILKQNPEHYTLQLVAGNNIKTLRTFIELHSLTEPLAIYRSTRKNKPWFGLIHGSFPNIRQANDARDRLSKTLRQTKPWVRQLSPLQKELRAAALTP